MDAGVGDNVEALQVQSERVVQTDNGEPVVHPGPAIVLESEHPGIELNRLVLIFHWNYRVV